MKQDNRSLSSPENGRRSHGPKTEEGKARSSQNATSHGGYSNRLLLPCENEEDLNQLIQEHLDLWRPRNPIETRLVREMALVMWRMQRISRSESTLLDIQMQRMTPALEAEFVGITPEAAYALAHHALLSHNGAAAALARQERRLLRQYGQLRAELDAVRQQPPVEQPVEQPTTHPADAPERNAENKSVETNLIDPAPIAAKIRNPHAKIFEYLPKEASLPPVPAGPAEAPKVRAAS